MRVMNFTRDGNLRCRYLEDPVNPVFEFWQMATQNRHWLMFNFRRFAESGFIGQWRKWSFHILLLLDKIWYRDTERELMKEDCDIINMKKIWSVVIICGILFFCSFASFCFEVLYGDASNPCELLIECGHKVSRMFTNVKCKLMVFLERTKIISTTETREHAVILRNQVVSKE